MQRAVGDRLLQRVGAEQAGPASPGCCPCTRTTPAARGSSSRPGRPRRRCRAPSSTRRGGTRRSASSASHCSANCRPCALDVDWNDVTRSDRRSRSRSVQKPTAGPTTVPCSRRRASRSSPSVLAQRDRVEERVGPGGPQRDVAFAPRSGEIRREEHERHASSGLLLREHVRPAERSPDGVGPEHAVARGGERAGHVEVPGSAAGVGGDVRHRDARAAELAVPVRDW